jgi:predicted RNA-binding protein with PIN domain
MNAKTKVIVDGYNVLKSTAQFAQLERQSIEDARIALVDYVSRKAYQYEIIVVFDGWETGATVETSERSRGVKIIFSKRGERADDVIVRIAEAAKCPTIVITRDGVLRQRVNMFGSQVEAPETLFSTPRAPRKFRQPKDEEECNRRTDKKGPSSRPKKNRGPQSWHL